MLVYLLAVSILILLIPTVFADVRDDINSAKAEIKKLTDSIPILDSDIISQKNVIAGLERDVDIYKEREKDKRQRIGDSWLSFTEHEQALKDLTDAQTRLKDANVKLQATINSRNQIISDINTLEGKLKELREAPEPRAKNIGYFGIVLDNTCLTMIRNNITSDCPTYEDIITLFPDTSNRVVTGDFKYHNGIYQRTPTKLSDSFEFYRGFSDSLIFVDPPHDYFKSIRLVEIKANLDAYKLPNAEAYNATANTLKVGYGRYVDSCRLAYIDSGQWSYLLGDTISYLSSGCQSNSTTFDSVRIQTLQKTEHDITTSYKYKLAQWQNEMVKKCGKKVCLYEKDQPSPP